MRYIAFLRGINVGGHQVTMERLRAIFGNLGLANVRSYIQSGNLFFDSDQTDLAGLSQTIEQALQAELGYAVPVFLRTVGQVEQALDLEPFARRQVTDDMRLCIVFTGRVLPTDWDLPLLSPKKDLELVAVLDREAFVIWHLLNGRPPASFKFLDQFLGQAVTSRFFHTTAKILEAAKRPQPL